MLYEVITQLLQRQAARHLVAELPPGSLGVPAEDPDGVLAVELLDQVAADKAGGAGDE